MTITTKGHPLAPKHVVGTFGNQIGCMVRETVKITTSDLRKPENKPFHEILFRKLHALYKYPHPEGEPKKYDNSEYIGNIVNNAALSKMNNCLAAWKHRVKVMIYEDKKTFAEIILKEPRISEDDLRDFKAVCDIDSSKAHSQWGKDLRDLNVGNHRLGCGGYVSIQEKWDKEEAECEEHGITDPLAQYSPRTKNFIKARYTYDPVTSEYKPMMRS